MNNKFLAFDIETHKITPKDANPLDYRPLGIACAATVKSDERKPIAWYNDIMYGNPEPTPDAMNVETSECLLDYLIRNADDGYTIVTWNGNFDFVVLYDSTGGNHACKGLAESHIDPMFQVFCIKGFPLGLDKAAHGMGLKGKLEDVSGALAPELWQGDLEDRLKVLEYVKQDALTTLELAEKINNYGYISWMSSRGYPISVQIPALCTVKEARYIAEPDTSWMDNPKKREDFYSWTRDNV